MDNNIFLEDLFNNLKDKIEDDSDVYAIYNILKKELEENITKSIKWFKYILSKYNIKDIRRNIDCLPLVRDFPVLLIKKRGFKDFIGVLKGLNESNTFIVLAGVFNIYDDLAIMSIIRNKIKIRQDEDILRLVKIIKDEKIREDIFDFDSFLREIIKSYIKYDYINKEVLFKYIEMGSNEKEKALLKSLIIDYI